MIDDPLAVDERLQQLGLQRDRLVRAVLRGDAGASSSTALHPSSDAGYRRWSDTVAGLRLAFLPHGWSLSNAQNYCTIYNPQTRIAVVVMAGDIKTGSRISSPRSKYPKGAATGQRLRLNQEQQTSMFPDIKAPHEVVSQDCKTWVLVQYGADDGVHIELSLAKSQDKAGFVVTWYERLLFPTIDPRGESLPVEDMNAAATDNIDFPVTPRASNG